LGKISTPICPRSIRTQALHGDFISQAVTRRRSGQSRLTSVQERPFGRKVSTFAGPLRLHGTSGPHQDDSDTCRCETNAEEFAELVRKKLVLEGLIAYSPVTLRNRMNAAVGIAALASGPARRNFSPRRDLLLSTPGQPSRPSLPHQLAAGSPACLRCSRQIRSRRRVVEIDLCDAGPGWLYASLRFSEYLSSIIEDRPVEPTTNSMGKFNQPTPPQPPPRRPPSRSRTS